MAPNWYGCCCYLPLITGIIRIIDQVVITTLSLMAVQWRKVETKYQMGAWNRDKKGILKSKPFFPLSKRNDVEKSLVFCRISTNDSCFAFFPFLTLKASLDSWIPSRASRLSRPSKFNRLDKSTKQENISICFPRPQKQIWWRSRVTRPFRSKHQQSTEH